MPAPVEFDIKIAITRSPCRIHCLICNRRNGCGAGQDSQGPSASPAPWPSAPSPDPAPGAGTRSRGRPRRREAPSLVSFPVSSPVGIRSCAQLAPGRTLRIRPGPVHVQTRHPALAPGAEAALAAGMPRDEDGHCLFRALVSSTN